MTDFSPQRNYPVKKRRSVAVVLSLIAVFAVLVCGVGAVGCTAIVNQASEEIDKEQEAKKDAVRLSLCVTAKAADDIFPHVKVDLEVVNSTDSQQTYFMDIFVKNEKGERIANGSAMITDVRPGQLVKHSETIALSKAIPKGAKITCSIDKVS